MKVTELRRTETTNAAVVQMDMVVTVAHVVNGNPDKDAVVDRWPMSSLMSMSAEVVAGVVRRLAFDLLDSSVVRNVRPIRSTEQLINIRFHREDDPKRADGDNSI